MIPPLDKQISGEHNVDKLQSALKTFVTPLENNPLLDGNLIECGISAANSALIPHGLGRQPIGWIIVDLVAAPGAVSCPLRTAWDTRNLTLFCNTSVTLKIWVF